MTKEQYQSIRLEAQNMSKVSLYSAILKSNKEVFGNAFAWKQIALEEVYLEMYGDSEYLALIDRLYL